jgi:predicted nucleic acid-binding protein
MLLSGALDANAIIGLAKGQVFDLLQHLYSPLYVPEAVVREILGQGSGRPGAAELQPALGAWLIPTTPDTALLSQIQAPGALADRQVLAVSLAHAVDHVLSDDGRLRREAGRHGLTCVRMPEVVVLMKSLGLVPEVKPVLDRMWAQGYGLTDIIYQQALGSAGE